MTHPSDRLPPRRPGGSGRSRQTSGRDARPSGRGGATPPRRRNSERIDPAPPPPAGPSGRRPRSSQSGQSGRSRSSGGGGGSFAEEYAEQQQRRQQRPTSRRTRPVDDDYDERDDRDERRRDRAAPEDNSKPIKIAVGAGIVVLGIIIAALRMSGPSARDQKDTEKYNAPVTSNSGMPGPADDAGDADPTAAFANPDGTKLTIDDETRHGVQHVGMQWARVMSSGTPVTALGFNMDRMFWEAMRRLPDDIRAQIQKNRMSELTAFRENQLRQFNEHRAKAWQIGLRYERADLHSAAQVEGRPELITYWRLFRDDGSMERVVLWLIKGGDNGWKIYDSMDVEINRRHSWDAADAFVRAYRNSGIETDLMVDKVNRLLNKDYSTVMPTEFDEFIKAPALAHYRAYLESQKLLTMCYQPEPDEKAIRAYATKLLASPDAPELVGKTFGNFLFDIRDYKGAIEHLTRFIDRLGPDDDTCHTLGVALEWSTPTRREEARAIYQKWVDVAYKPGRCHSSLAILDLEDGKIDVVHGRFVELIKQGLAANEVENIFREYCVNKAYDGLIKLIDGIPSKLRPHTAPYWAGRALMGAGKPDEAALSLAQYRRAEGEGPDLENWCKLMAIACDSNAGRSGNALRRLQDNLDLLQRKKAAIEIWSAVFHAAAGDFEHASDSIVAARRADDKSIGVLIEITRERVIKGAPELWANPEVGAYLQAWYSSLTGENFDPK
ncbi:MAG: hypothetical protein AB7S36_08680 [Planctomycetota bacterium]